jgi:hypothetical protein
MAAMRDQRPFCIAGITFVVAILATPRTPHVTGSISLTAGPGLGA